MGPIPLVDLAAQHDEIASEVEEGWAKVVAGTSFTLGPQVAEFEQAFAEFSGVAHCVGVANGTDALEMALRAAGIGPGDEIILPTNTFIATAEAVVRCGAKPVLVDCDSQCHLIDPDQVSAAVTARTAAIIPVHLFGQVAPMTPLLKLADDYGLMTIEDGAQSQGASQNGTGAGSFGIAAGTSFYPGKNLGAYGDAGAVLTNDDELAETLLALRNHGSPRKYHHPQLGFNSRLDSLQAVVLSAKLKRLAYWNHRRQWASQFYHQLLADFGIGLPHTYPGNEPVWHLYVVRVPHRDAVLEQLNQAGIGAGVHYPIPIHLQGAFEYLGHTKSSFPEAEKAANEILSLPLYPHITEEQQMFVAQSLLEALRTVRS